jgi:predicted ATP-dependent serine protease
MRKIYKTYKGLSIPEHDFNSIIYPDETNMYCTSCSARSGQCVGHCVECLFHVSNLEILKEWHNKQLRERKLERILKNE